MYITVCQKIKSKSRIKSEFSGRAHTSRRRNANLISADRIAHGREILITFC